MVDVGAEQPRAYAHTDTVDEMIVAATHSRVWLQLA